MNLSQPGLELIARFEGLRLTPYKAHPSEKHWTIGYGHYGPDVKPGQRITRDRALQLLRTDAQEAVDAVTGLVKRPLTQNQFDALVSFVFNVGAGAFRTSTLLRKLNAGNAKAAEQEFHKWVKAGGETLAGLVKRRDLEADLFARGPDASAAARWLTIDELRRVRNLDELRRTGQGDSARARALERVLTQQRKRIWQAAQKDGWDKAHRRERYRSLRARTT